MNRYVLINTINLDRKYILLLSNRLDGFKQKSQNLFNCRCPICGDSKSRKNIRRGYFYLKNDHFVYYCHNNASCSSNIKGFLRKYDTALYNQYRMDMLEKKRDERTPITRTNISLKYDDSFYSQKLKELQKVSQLEVNHPGKKYIMDRQIPSEFHSLLRWTPTYMEWVNSFIKGKFDEKALFFDEGRIVIPYFNLESRLVAMSGRSISDSFQRYISILLDRDANLLYGLERINWKEKVYVVEGQFDSMFLTNCLALSGSNINSLTKYASPDSFVIIYDNEPRKKETRKKLLAAINGGYSVCLWPQWIEEKDINDMVRKGRSTSSILQTICANTFKGLEAKIHLEQRGI